MRQGEFESIMRESLNEYALPLSVERRAQRVCAKLQLRAYKGKWRPSDVKRWQFAVGIINKVRERN